MIAAAPRKYRIASDTYQQMAASGLLPAETRLELIEGEIVEMAAMNSPHAAMISLLGELLYERASRMAQVRLQLPLRLSDFSMPEPDAALVVRQPHRYRQQHPTAADTLLVIEVADSSLDYDRKVKMPLYARHGIGEAWLVDLNQHCLECYRQPSAQGYQFTQIYKSGDTVNALNLRELFLQVKELFE